MESSCSNLNLEPRQNIAHPSTATPVRIFHMPLYPRNCNSASKSLNLSTSCKHSISADHSPSSKIILLLRHSQSRICRGM
nr:hypothetical protein Iba_scaffold44083CG0010 [Ipomoea batatas]